jgi:hypothetical protein
VGTAAPPGSVGQTPWQVRHTVWEPARSLRAKLQRMYMHKDAEVTEGCQKQAQNKVDSTNQFQGNST